MDKTNRAGFIFFMVVGILSVMATVGMTFFFISTQNKKLSDNYILKAKSNLLIESGFDVTKKKIYSNINFMKQIHHDEFSIGEGTFVVSGDRVRIEASDLNGKININDGIRAGEYETQDSLQSYPLNNYYSNTIDPWPVSEDDAFEPPDGPISNSDMELYEKSRSALINLRLRRLLNAYGEVHRFIALAFDGDVNHVVDPNYVGQLPNPVFSTRLDADETHSVDGRRYQSMAYYINDDRAQGLDDSLNSGLGDRVIVNRPQSGYSDLSEIKQIVNLWADEQRFAQSYLNEESFYDLIKSDLTTVSFETEFYRIDDERRFGHFDKTDQADHGDFEPQDMQLNPPNFEKMWVHHSIPLINLNQASFFVRSAVFYAPTNVSYAIQGATTIPPYIGDDVEGRKYFDSQTAVQSMIASPSLGVGPPVFIPEQERRENSVDGVGRRSHFMSLTDAMKLAWHYEYDSVYDIESFPTFYRFLQTYENSNVRGSQYERVLPRKEKLSWTYPLNSGVHFNAGYHYYVAPYDLNHDSTGEFVSDYVSRTLPHLFSCVRRIPSYLSAPVALQSPYLALKPDYEREEYKQGELCRQGFYKIEDFVFRFLHPKVCFTSCGYYDFKIEAFILDQFGHEVTKSKNHSLLKLFETKYLRSQNDFAVHTYHDASDPDGFYTTNQKIMIGPEFSQSPQYPSQVLGFVGIRDNDQDLTFFDQNDDPTDQGFNDTYMTYQQNGYRPHLILNFDPEIAGGFKNDKAGAPQLTNPSKDDWIIALNDHEQSSANGLLNSQIEMSFQAPFLADASSPASMCDLSPFGGAHFSSMGHGEFAKSQFTDSMYWRLDPWINPRSRPVGQDLSLGIMTFWFQMPSTYDFPTVVGLDGDLNQVRPESFSQTLVALNLWERYQFEDGPLSQTLVQRPVTITVGLKKTQELGQCVFARYDSAGESYYGSGPLEYPYIAPAGYSFLMPSLFNRTMRQYDHLGFWCDDVDYQENGGTLSYEFYRAMTHRSAEVALGFKNYTDNAPGTWHRVSVYWDLKWDAREMESNQHLYIDLHDSTNKSVIDQIHTFNLMSEAAPFGHMPGDPFDYPRDDLAQGNLGFMHGFDSTMVLSLGETHARRFYGYTLKNVDGKEVTSTHGRYYPYWRLNSTIDNFRLYMGPSQNTKIPNNYFDPNFLLVDVKENRGGALRYRINGGKLNKPKWVIDPQISQSSRLLSIGSRIYYPGNHSTVFLPNSSTNSPYIKMYGYHFRENERIREDEILPQHVSFDEQTLIYNNVNVEENFRINLRYVLYKPLMDSDQESHSDFLKYSPEAGDQFTEVAWIKEVSFRYVSGDSYQVIKSLVN